MASSLAKAASRGRYFIPQSGAADDRAGMLEVDTLERVGEVVGVALAADLPVGDDAEPGALLVGDGHDDSVVLSVAQPCGVDAPELPRAQAGRQALVERLPIDEPVRLGVGADEARGDRVAHETGQCRTSRGGARR
jgi:hypothetical protein